MVSFIGGRSRNTRRKPPTCRKSLTNFITCCIEYTLPWTGFEITTLVKIGTDCTGSCKSTYHDNSSLNWIWILSIYTANLCLLRKCGYFIWLYFNFTIFPFSLSNYHIFMSVILHSIMKRKFKQWLSTISSNINKTNNHLSPQEWNKNTIPCHVKNLEIFL